MSKSDNLFYYIAQILYIWYQKADCIMEIVLRVTDVSSYFILYKLKQCQQFLMKDYHLFKNLIHVSA